MQQLMASLVFGMSVDDAAYKAGMASARAEARKTEQDFGRAGEGMAAHIQDAAREVNRAVLTMVDGFHRAIASVKQAGLGLTVGLTLPLGLAGKSAKDTAATFQSAMGKVQAAMLSASPKELEKLRDAALELGPAMGRSAIEAAGAIESLAKNGMSAASILGGGLKSALTLATVGEAGLSEAADLTTDIMAQFGKTAGDLPKVVDNISGALDASKLSFDDYRLAAGQAGGVTGALGYTFEDFNTGLAATAPLFESGASAGTSFRAFLTSLAGKSEDATRAMKQLGLSFYEADGSAKPLAAIADELQKKMGNLSARSKSVFLTAMFGADGGQTAVKLIELGADGIERAQRAINGVTADQKVAVLLDGEAAATNRLVAAWEKLKIGIGEAGLIQVMTAIKNTMASLVETIASAPPAVFYLINGLGLAAAAIGPLVLGIGALVGVLAPVIVGMGSFGVAARIAVGILGAIVNPIGMLGRGLLFIAAQAGAATVVGRLATALAGVVGPIGLVVTGAAILWPMIKALGEVSEATAKAQEDAAKAHGDVQDVMQRLATATGNAKDEAIAHAKALRAQHLQQLQTAKSAILLARAQYAKLRDGEKAGGAGAMTLLAQLWTGRSAAGARKDLEAAIGVGQQRLADFSQLEAAIAGAGGAAPKVDLDLADPEKKGRKKKGRDAAEDQARYDNELGQLKVERLRAEADLSEGIRSRHKAELAALDEERASYARNLANDDALTDAKRKTLLAAKDEELAVRRTIAERDLSVGLAQEEYDLFAARNDAQQEVVRATLDLADSAAAQREGQMRLLELQRQREAADIELILATKATASAEYQNALDRKRDLADRYARLEAGILRQTEGPAAGYLRGLSRSGDAMREDVQAGGVEALKGLNSELLSAGLNVRKLGDAFANMGHRIIASLADIAIQQKLIKPLAESLLGTGGSGGWLSSIARGLGLSGGSRMAGSDLLTAGSGATSVAAMGGSGLVDLSSFGGFRAAGGPISPTDWYVVGERGPEIFAPGASGTIIPNGGRGGRRQPTIVELHVGEGQLFEPRVAGISGDVSVRTAQASARAGALRRRQSL